MRNKTQKHNTQRGFTLIETLVAIFILLISVTGPMSFAQSGLRASFVARDQVVAFYLAQDAVETIKNVRDNNSLNSENWLDGLDVCVSPAGSAGLDTPCEIETDRSGVTNNIAVRSCGSAGDTCPPLKYNSVDKEFLLSTDTSASSATSKYTRTVYINEIVDEQEAQIIVEVSWDTQFLTERRVVVQENIYNWVPLYTSP